VPWRYPASRVSPVLRTWNLSQKGEHLNGALVMIYGDLIYGDLMGFNDGGLKVI